MLSPQEYIGQAGTLLSFYYMTLYDRVTGRLRTSYERRKIRTPMKVF
jgi:hypothetical protein